MGPAPTTRADLSRTSPARDTACQATEAGSTQSGVTQTEPVRKGSQHPAGQGRVLDESPIAMREPGRASRVRAGRGQVRTIRWVAGDAVIPGVAGCTATGSRPRARCRRRRPALPRRRPHGLGPSGRAGSTLRPPVRPVVQVLSRTPPYATSTMASSSVGSRSERSARHRRSLAAYATTPRDSLGRVMVSSSLEGSSSR